MFSDRSFLVSWVASYLFVTTAGEALATNNQVIFSSVVLLVGVFFVKISKINYFYIFYALYYIIFHENLALGGNCIA